MPTKAELQKRLTAARAEIARLQQYRMDLSSVQADLHKARAEIARLQQSKQEVPQMADIKSEDLADCKRQLVDKIAENKMLRGQYHPTSEQVRRCMAEIDRLNAIIEGT